MTALCFAGCSLVLAGLVAAAGLLRRAKRHDAQVASEFDRSFSRERR